MTHYEGRSAVMKESRRLSFYGKSTIVYIAAVYLDSTIKLMSFLSVLLVSVFLMVAFSTIYDVTYKLENSEFDYISEFTSIEQC